jgi:hypothetical protein
MMNRFAFDLATPADDASLRQLLAATPMIGRVSVAFAREPSYFEAAAVDGSSVQIGVAREHKSGRVVGMGSRAVSVRFVNGERVAVGFLSGLRLLTEYRGHAALLARGYRFLRKLHEDRAARYYLTTISDDNQAALNLLTSGRAGLPIYHPCGNYSTLSVYTAQQSANGAENRCDAEIRPANAADRDAIVQFLNDHGAARNFFPAYNAYDLFNNTGLLRGLASSDLLLALRDDKIVGTLGCWDQRPFKQIVIHSYSGWLRPLRPFYNAWASLRHRPTLPAAGTVLGACLAAIPVVSDDHPEVFRQLLTATLRRMADRRLPLLLVGMHESDPLLPVARQFSGREYRTKLYIVHWPDETPDIESLTRRVPYLELGAL